MRTLRMLCTALLGLLVAAAPALGGGFSVLPTRVQFGNATGVQSVLLTNTSGRTVTVESQVVVWPDDAAGQQPSDVVVTPAVVTLPPGQRVRVRIGLLRAGSGEAERAYRLYFTELPSPPSLQNAGIGVRLRIGIPVFVAPQQARLAALDWRAARDASGWHLLATNAGNVHVRIADPKLLRDAQRTPLEIDRLYVLAGATLRVDAPPGIALAPGMHVQWQDGDHARDSTLALP